MKICTKCKEETTVYNKDYYRTKKGLISQRYQRQKKSSRKRGHETPRYTRDELLEYCLNSKEFTKLYNRWVSSDFITELTPSIDRLDNSKGYSFENIQIVTWRQNNLNSHKTNMVSVYQYDLNGVLLMKHKSINEASDYVGCDGSSISRCCNGVRKTAGGYRWNKK